MKRLIGLLALSLFIFSAKESSAQILSPDMILGYVFPDDIDYRYMDSMPYGHLHKNKPKYGKYVWKPIESQHFIAFNYSDDDELSAFYLKIFEEAFSEFSIKTGIYNFSDKIRINITNSQRDFEETNLFSGIVPRGLGGFTEIGRWKRVTISYRDSPFGFRRLLRHELAHRFHIEMKPDAPLWFIEGAAEQMSHEWDTRGEMIMRDAYLNNYLAQADSPMGWYNAALVYKEGEFILHFLVKEYAQIDNVTVKIMKESKKLKFDEAFQKVTGDTLEEFQRKLQKEIDRRYSPLLIKTDITDQVKPLGAGILLADRGPFSITKREKRGRVELLLNWTDGTEIKSKRLFQGGRLNSVDAKGFDVELSAEFGFNENGASFASDSLLLYAIDKGGYDALVTREFSFDSKKKKLKLGKKKEYLRKTFRDIQYPVAINEKEIAFVGRDSVFAEIFIFNKDTGELRRLTSERRTYRGLTYSKYLNALITSVENEKTGSYDLAAYYLDSKESKLITESKENEYSPSCSENGEQLFYVSDAGLVNNIYLLNFKKETAAKLTDAKIGFVRPHWFDGEGVIFNSFQKGGLAIYALPLAKNEKTENAVNPEKQNSEKNRQDPETLKAKLPNSEFLTIFDTAVSPDKTKILYAENRKMSMEKLENGKLEIRFHLLDTVTGEIKLFSLKEFNKLKNYGSMEFLAGTNVLLQKNTVTVEKSDRVTDSNGQPLEEEVAYKESYIYDWSVGKSHKLDTEVVSAFSGSNRLLSKKSSDNRYLIWIAEEKKKITVYDVLKKEERKIDGDFSEIQDAVFLPDNSILVLCKEWQVGLHLAKIDLENSANNQKWKNVLSKEFNFEKASWYPLITEPKVFFAVLNEENKSVDILLFNLDASTLTAVKTDLPMLQSINLREGKLNLGLNDEFGQNQKLTIDKDGTIQSGKQSSFKELNLSAFSQKISGGVVPRMVLSQDPKILRRDRKLKKLPKVMYAYGGAMAIFDGGIRSFLMLQTLAFDELDDRAIGANIFLQEMKYGVADIVYYNFDTGRSYGLDYWHFDQDRKRMNISASQNIFLHQYLNWDVSVRQQYVKSLRPTGVREWWQTKLGTTFSVDTTVWDCEAAAWRCHGPHSGIAAFSGLESSFDYQKGYRATDLNLDARYYAPFTDRSGLALRLAAGKSFGSTPNVFIWGGNQSFRGVSLFGQAGNAYVLQSVDLRFPILDAAGAVPSGPFGRVFAPLTLLMDIRGGLYNDIGDIWYTGKPLFDGHQNFKRQHSAGYFFNIPTILGVNFRFNKGVFGEQGWNFWLGYNW